MTGHVNGSDPGPSTGTVASPGQYAAINGLDLYYEVHGDGPPLVLLHGGMLTIDLCFGELIPALAVHHQVIAIELQGHGHTADIDREIDLDLLADDVGQLLGLLAIERADLFGFSLGALVSLALVIDRPTLVGRLVLASAHYRPDGYHAEISQPATGSSRLPTEDDFAAMVEAYNAVAPDPAHFFDFMSKTSTTVAAFEGWSAEQLRAIEAPTLLLVGDTDFVRLEHAVEMFDLIPDAQLAVLPATTHMTVLRDSARLLALVEPFLARVAE